MALDVAAAKGLPSAQCEWISPWVFQGWDFCSAEQRKISGYYLPLQLRVLGFLPLVFDVAGSRVAATMAGAARRAIRPVKCILKAFEGLD
jgi:hypothetical protein